MTTNRSALAAALALAAGKSGAPALPAAIKERTAKVRSEKAAKAAPKAKAPRAPRKPKAPIVCVMNGQTINIDVAKVAMPDIIAEIERVTRSAHGAHIRFAAKLNLMLPFAWFDISADEVSLEATKLNEQKKPYYAALKAAGHSNPSKAFGDVKGYGKNLRAGLSPNGKTMANGKPIPASKQPAGEGQSTGGANENEARSPMVRNVDELVALYKYNVRTNSPLEKIKAAQGHIMAALAALGVDVRTIKTDKSK